MARHIKRLQTLTRTNAALWLSAGLSLLPALTLAQVTTDRSRLTQPLPVPQIRVGPPLLSNPSVLPGRGPQTLYNPALPLNGYGNAFGNVNRQQRPDLFNGPHIDFNALFGRSTPQFYTVRPGGNGYSGNTGGLPDNTLYGGTYGTAFGYGNGYANPPANYYDVTHDFTLLNSPTRILQRRDRPGDILNGGTMPGSLPARHDVNGNYIGPGRPDAATGYLRGNGSFDYINGLCGRGNLHPYGNWGQFYFPNGGAYYPYYASSYDYGLSVVSPYGYYSGTLPSYIGSDYVYQTPPQVVYVPVPVYRDGAYQGYRTEDLDDYYLNRRNDSTNSDNNTGGYHVDENGNKPVVKQEPALAKALTNIETAWRDSDIQQLAKHIRKDARIAVYLRGKYQYSLDAADYLDMTRDALRATKTSRFELDQAQRKENGVYTVTGRHIYRDKQGQERTVYVSYVLEKSDGNYYITQVGTAPQQVDEAGGQ